jgi:RecA-family ATPase
VSDITAKVLAEHLKTLADKDAIDKLFRQARMLAAASASDEMFKSPIRTLGDYLNADIEIPPVLVHPFLCVRGGLNVTVGRAGKGKTVMNLNRMLRWGAGLPMFDGWVDKEGNALLAPDMPLKILIVENEGAAGMFHRQIGIMLHANDYLPQEAQKLAKENVLIWGEGGYSNLKLDDPTKLDGLRRGIEEWEPDLVFIEPFRSLWNGEENSATEMNIVVDALVGIATDYNCGVWAAHHEKKGGAGEDDKMSAARGSTVLEGIVTVMENFESTKGGAQRELMWSKSRYEVAPPPVTMEWDHEAKWYKHVPAEQVEDDIIQVFKEVSADEPMNLTDLSEELGIAKTKLRKHMDKLTSDGKLKKMKSESGPGGSTGFRWRLPTTDNDGYGGLGL